MVNANQYYGANNQYGNYQTPYMGAPPQQNWNMPIQNNVPNIQQPQMQDQQAVQNFAAPARSYIPGRLVSSEKEIRPNEVLSDGSPTIFPMADRTRILLKEVTQDGTIATSTYVLESSTQPQAGDDVLAGIVNRLENIEKMLKRSTRHRGNKPNKEANNT